MKPYILFFLLFLSTGVRAQDSVRFRYGFVAGWSSNLHTADFRALPGVPNCCPQFTSGSGGGLQGGVFAALPLGNHLLFSVAANYADQSATLTDDEPLWIIANGVGQSGSDRHTVDATLSMIGLEPSVSYNLFAGLFVTIGARAGLVLSRAYSQDEHIVEPVGTGTFIDSLGNDTHSQIRNQYSGSIPNVSSILLFVNGGLSYELPLNSTHTLFLVPQASYSLALTNLSSVTWKPNSIRSGIGLTFSPKPDERTFNYDTTLIRDTTTRFERSLTNQTITLVSTDRTQTVVDNVTQVQTTTIVREHYLLEVPDRHDVACSISAVGLDADNAEEQIATLRIEEFHSTNAHPLLGYVFFGEGESVIPNRYHIIRPEEAAHFDLHKLFSLDALGVHHDGLNIIGYRMKQFPKAKLTITGCNSDQGNELNDSTLSSERAHVVYEYFRRVWNIDASRLVIAVRNLPEKPSNPRSPDGQQENRRVELGCSVPEVLDVFLAEDTLRTPNPPQLRFKLHTSSSVGIASWSLDVLQGRTKLHHAEGIGNAPSIVDWDLEHDQHNIPHYGEPLRMFLQTTNTKGDLVTDSTRLPTEIVTLEQKKARHAGDIMIDRYNLVLFSFGTAAMSPAHERVLKLVRARLAPTSSISIDGYTDRTGSSASNKRLATQRATATSTGLGRKDAHVKGIGEDRLLYPNDTPEGRFLCRTVEIVVRTPFQ